MTARLDTFRIGLAAAALIGAGTLAGMAQTAAPQTTVEALGPLTAEVRALRLAVERSGRMQGEVQALGVALSAQQSRLVQLSQRLDATRRDLAAAEGQVRQFDDLMKRAQVDLSNTPPAERSDAGGMLQLFKGQADHARQDAETLRARELALYQQIQQEEARWTDLIGRLEAATKR